MAWKRWVRWLMLVGVLGVIFGRWCVRAIAMGEPPISRLTLVPRSREPEEGREMPGPATLAALEQAVREQPLDRARHLDLVQGLRAAGRTEEALGAARNWREHDAYNLVVVRLIGDLLAELDRPEAARRTYSAVAELLPEDVAAQHALAAVLKQSGDLEAAYGRLLTCARLAPDDRRLGFELADVTARLGRDGEARGRLESLVGDAATPAELRYPARQRLAQILTTDRRRAAASGDVGRARADEETLDRLAIEGGVENDVKAFLTWDTDRTDVDLWVTTPAGEKVYYGHKRGNSGEALFHDVTTGYGPESFTAHRATPGRYLVQVNYYAGGRGAFAEARGEVALVLDEGRANETRRVLPYRLYHAGQTVTVAEIVVQ